MLSSQMLSTTTSSMPSQGGLSTSLTHSATSGNNSRRSASNSSSKKPKDRGHSNTSGETPFQRPSVSASIVKSLPRNSDDAGHRTKYDSNQGDNHSVCWNKVTNSALTDPCRSYPCPVSNAVLTVNNLTNKQKPNTHL